MDKLLRNKKAIILFVAPAFILFTVVLLIPICKAIYYSFCNYKALHPVEFYGFGKDMFKNYVKLFTKDRAMKAAMKNSLFFMFFSIISQLVMGLILAALLTNIKKGRNLFKNIYYLPCVLSSAALGLLWMFVFTPRLGINQMLASLGKWGGDCTLGPQWLFNTEGYIILPIWVVSFVALWQYVGQSMMLYMAQISGIDTSLFEAAYIDGASRLQAFRYVTLPLLVPMMATAMSLNCIGSLKFFDLVFNMTEAGPNHATEVLATHLYTQGFKFFKYGYASAIGVILLILCLLLTFLINKYVKVKEDYI
jgi:raffinose/stachyose/melibiose transport system permease protein